MNETNSIECYRPQNNQNQGIYLIDFVVAKVVLIK